MDNNLPFHRLIDRPLNRRRALLGMAAGAGTTLVAGAAFADHHMGGGSKKKMDGDYAMSTLRLGMMSLKASEMAQKMASSEAVKTFAKLEAAEQKTVEKVLLANGATKPELEPAQQEKLDMLETQSGRLFDQAYLDAQQEAHAELLDLQQQKKGGDLTQPGAVLANLAINSIKSHQAMIEMILKTM